MRQSRQLTIYFRFKDTKAQSMTDPHLARRRRTALYGSISGSPCGDSCCSESRERDSRERFWRSLCKRGVFISITHKLSTEGKSQLDTSSNNAKDNFAKAEFHMTAESFESGPEFELAYWKCRVANLEIVVGELLLKNEQLRRELQMSVYPRSGQVSAPLDS